MERFTYVRAANVAHAISLLNAPEYRSRALAGGTDLLLMLREEPDAANRVVDITQVDELHRIERGCPPTVALDGAWVTIGSAASFAEVMESPLVQATAPLLAEACHNVGAVQIRNMGTLGGNVANAAACADSLPALVCLDAFATVATPEGAWSMPVSEVVRRPNQTLIPPGGLLVSLSYRVPLPGSRGAFIKLGRRNAMAISRLTVAALLRLDANGVIAEARVVPGAATPQITRFPMVEQTLLGQTPSDELFVHAGYQAAVEMIGVTGRRWSTEYKELALAAMVTRALRKAWAAEPVVAGRVAA